MNRFGENSNAAQPVRRRWFSWLVVGVSLITLLVWFNWPAKDVATVSSSIQIEPVVVGEDASADVTDLAGTEDLTDSANSGSPEAAVETGTETLNRLISQSLIDQAEHPLDPVLAVAKWSMEAIDCNIQDYTCRITSQVFIDGRLDKERQMDVKIRHSVADADPKLNADTDSGTEVPNESSQQAAVPFGVYLRMLAPRHVTGQEVIWVDGQNEGKLVAHAGSGLLKMKRVYLAPDGPIAMRGSRYPIWDIGFKNLITKMYEIGCCDRDHDDCRVRVTPEVKVESRSCLLIEIIHERENPSFQFHHAKIYVDRQRKIPIGFESYGWPKQPGDRLPLIEKFYYTNVQLNAGLGDIDFSPDNPAYEYPSW